MELVQAPGRSYRHRYEGPFFRRLLLLGIRYIPSWLKTLTMPLWAGIFFLLIKGARRAAASNLDQVLGPTSALERLRRCFRLFLNYAHMLTESYTCYLGEPLHIEAISIGRQNLLSSLAEGKGVIAATGHLGMWQLGPFLAEWNDLPTFHVAMAEEPNPLVQEFEERFRSRFRIVYTTGTPFAALQLMSILREGGILGIQMDRHLGGPSIRVPFFGKDANFAAGPATLARLSGSALVPIFFVVDQTEKGTSRKRVYHFVEAPIEVPNTRNRTADIEEATRRLAQVYERFVRRYAYQWYNFHDFWKEPARKDAS